MVFVLEKSRKWEDKEVGDQPGEYPNAFYSEYKTNPKWETPKPSLMQTVPALMKHKYVV